MIPEFSLYQPYRVEEAAQLARDLDEVAYIAGGTELGLLMKLGLVAYDNIVDVKRIGELQEIRADDDGLWIGAGVTHRRLEDSDIVRSFAPELCRIEGELANVRVRSSGTLGGNVCFAEPHSDPAPFLIAWGGRLVLANASSRRVVPADEFFVGPLETARAQDELLVSVMLPVLVPGTTIAHERFAYLERPAVSVSVRLRLAGDEVVDVRIAIGGVSETTERLLRAEEVLEGTPVRRAGSAIEAAARVSAASCDPIDDIQGSSAVKKQWVKVLVGRACQRAMEGASRHVGA